MNLKSISFRLQAIVCTGLWLSLGFLTRLAARAGGAGGHSSSSHGSSGGSHSSSHGSSFGGGSSYHGSGGSSSGGSPGSFFFIILLVVVVIIAISLYRTFGKSSSAPLASRPLEPDVDSESFNHFLTDHPDFDLPAFTAKVHNAFLKIQAAWSAQNIGEVRPFISDGVYQRFATQFRMMGLLKQSNPLDQIQVHGIGVVSARTDGPYDVIDVSIQASAHDAFVCELDHSLDTEAYETFVEYWSFIRKRGAGNASGDLYGNPNCPSCGAALPKDMGELCRCSYCQVIVNSGEFDWVLAEITQQADYENQARMADLGSPLPGELAWITPECPDFSTQLAEDKASNAFMQIMAALATRNPASVRRFVSDDVFAKVSAMIPDRNVIFNRIYLNESVLMHASRVGPRHRLDLRLAASMQRVELTTDQGIAPIDDEEIRTGHVLIMERDADAVPEKGSLYQHQCANCGGRVGDTLDLNCQYCGTPLNSTRNEWIVTGFQSIAEYNAATRSTSDSSVI